MPPDDPALEKALVFVSRCQNLKGETNNQPWAGKINDGSFIYTPASGGVTKAVDEPMPDGSLPGDGSVHAQTRQSFANLGTVLTALGLQFTDVLRFSTFVVGRSSIEPFMKARLEVFAEIYPDGAYPPNTLVLVSGLVEEQFSVEIEALAIG